MIDDVSGESTGLDALLDSRLAPFLVYRGFSRQRRTFWIRGTETWKALRFHANPDIASFTIRLFVGSERLASAPIAGVKLRLLDQAVIETYLEDLFVPKTRGYRDRAWWRLDREEDSQRPTGIPK